MNVKRFTGRNSREAMQKVKAAFGNEAVVLSTKPAAEGGIEILAMAADSVPAIDQYAIERDAPELVARQPEPQAQRQAPAAGKKAAAAKPVAQQARETMSNLAHTVQDDVKQLAMSTLSFQDYVRERMLKRRQAAMQARTEPAMALPPEEQLNQRFAAPKPQRAPVKTEVDLGLRTPQRAMEPEVDEWAALREPQAQMQSRMSYSQQQAEAERQARLAREAEQEQARLERQARQAEQQATRARPAQVVPLRSEHADLTIDKVTPARQSQADAATQAALKAAQEANATMLG